MANDVLKLPNYPSTSARKDLSPSQLATLNQTVATTLASVMALPQGKRDVPSTRSFLSSYAKDAAFQTLQGLIWKEDAESTASRTSTDEKLIHKRSLQLAEKLASSTPGLDVQSLLDLSIIYSRDHPSRLRTVFKTSVATHPSLPQVVSNDLVPGFETLLSQSQGLYAQRKLAECICSFVRGAKGIPELVRPFAHSKPFLVALATSYDAGMTATATSYGGTPALIAASNREPDDWERIWVETKVALLDAFHIILTTLLDDLASCPSGPQLAAEAERTFDIIFDLLDPPSSSSTGHNSNSPPVPFLNQSLLADYQQSYSLSHTLATALKHAQEKDARLDLLESILQSFSFDQDAHADGSDNNLNKAKGSKNAGVLKILLRSSGVQPGIDNLGTRTSQPQPRSEPTLSNDFDFQSQNKHNTNDNDKRTGKSRAAAPPSDPDLDIKTTQVLDILPDTPPDYVRLLLVHDRYGRNPEKVIEALLEGTAMSQEELEKDWQASSVALEPQNEQFDGKAGQGDVRKGDGHDHDDGYNVNQRRNVFDDEVLDVSMLRLGKKSAGEEVLRDRTYIEEMKADILRRAEAISDDEDEDDGGDLDPYGEPQPTPAKKKGKGKEVDSGAPPRAIDLGPDEDEEDVVGVRLAGDGEDSGDDDDDEEEDEEDEALTPETIVELAYLRDPKVFERDSATRRSKARIDLRSQTGWDDSQIESWKVMLDRNPGRKEKLLEKHAFRGNEKGLEVHAGGSGGSGRGRGGRGRGGPSRGGGRGRGGGSGGRGGGSGGGAGGGGEASARERAWKDKNKASRGNHNRKRGHDKKMAKAGALAGPST